MSRIEIDLSLRVFEELTGQDYGSLEKALVTQEDETLSVRSKKFESSQTIDLLDGFSHLRSIIVLGHFPGRISDLKEVTVTITDGGGSSTTILSPYFINLEIPSGSYNLLQVETTGASSNNPTNLKIIQLGS